MRTIRNSKSTVFSPLGPYGSEHALWWLKSEPWVRLGNVVRRPWFDVLTSKGLTLFATMLALLAVFSMRSIRRQADVDMTCKSYVGDTRSGVCLKL